MAEHDISTVSDANQDRAIATMTTAFVSDPFMRWMYPDPKAYLDAYPEILRAFGGAAFEHDSSHATADFSGATLWLPPGIEADEKQMEAIIGRTIAEEIQAEVGAVLEAIDQYHPHDEPTWYLAVIGVDPAYQRSGIGAALMQKMLAEIDAVGMQSYLESSNPANMSLYERHGFRTMGRIQVGSSPPIHPMLRPARDA